MFTLTVFAFVICTVAAWGAVVQVRRADWVFGAFLGVMAILMFGAGLAGAHKLGLSKNPLDWIRQPIPCGSEIQAVACQ
jgi:hypothetical protein